VWEAYKNQAFSHPNTCKLPFYRVFTKENATSFLRKSSSPFLLQELKPLTPLKTIDRFTLLMVIGMTKIMCNTSIHLIVIKYSMRFCVLFGGQEGFGYFILLWWYKLAQALQI
jgi:hypothetical protein